MAKRIFRAICLVAALVLICTATVLTAVLYANFENQAVQSLRKDVSYFALALQNEGLGYFDRLSSPDRITLVEADGTVIYDSAADQAAMENHLDRKEIQDALASGHGVEKRRSSTLAEETIYVAQRLEDGRILRVATTQRSVWALLLAVLQPVAMVVLLALAAALLLAGRVSKKIVAPINALDLEHPEANEGYEELSPLLSSIARLHRTIDRQLQEARQKQEEFRLITEHMSEGLLVLDQALHLLSCNGAALRLLGAANLPENVSVLALNRSEAFRTVLRQVLEGGHAEGILEAGGRTLQLMANPVRQEAQVAGAVLLVVDITERAQRDALRREFSANVSHELKTPLTSISGFAELLKSGVVAKEDVADFAGSIYDEAQRLIHLVEDIIRLSALDEDGLRQEMEILDLYALAQREAQRLRPEAEKRGLTLTVLGGEAKVLGSEQILSEMIYNLCDNAIKYNRPGGTVDVLVTGGETVKLLVRDTGTGIPQASQNRVFERFYRVDKSRSQDVTGTGLGLSIVKHGAQLHGAQITLESTEGKGTAITVEFPKASPQ